MKLIRYIILCLSGLLVQQSVNAQVKLMSSITTNSPDDTYATHIDSLGKGGFMSVPTKSIRDLLSHQRRKIGMLVYVSETDSVYQLKGDTTNAHWVSFKLTSTPSSTTMGWQGTQTTHPVNPQVNWAYYNSTDKKSYIYDGSAWQILAQDGTGSTINFNGNRPITLGLSPFTGVNPSTNDLAAWIEHVFYPTQGPTAGLSMLFTNPETGTNVSGTSTTQEMMATGGTISVTLNWTAGRQASTATLSTVVVGGASQSFTQPVQSASTNGSLIVNLTRNSNTTYTNQVTTSDAKNASASVSINFSWRRYYGFMTAPGGVSNGTGFTPSNAEILALSNNGFGSSRGFTSASLTPSGGQRMVIAYPLAWDPGPSVSAQIWVGGLESSSGFQRQVVSFTNASGGVTDYVVYVQLNNTSGNISFTIQ